MMRFSSASALRPLALASAAGVAALCSTPAQTECIGPSDAAALVPAKTAIASWEESRGIHVPSEQRDTILEQYCAAAKTITDELGVELAVVTIGAQEPLWAYLDASASTAEQVQTIEALVQTQYSLQASAWLPEIKPMGVVRITYRRAADALTMNGKRMEPYPKFFARLGPLSIVGLSRGITICSATLNVSGTRPAEFTC